MKTWEFIRNEIVSEILEINDPDELEQFLITNKAKHMYFDSLCECCKTINNGHEPCAYKRGLDICEEARESEA